MTTRTPFGPWQFDPLPRSDRIEWHARVAPSKPAVSGALLSSILRSSLNERVATVADIEEAARTLTDCGKVTVLASPGTCRIFIEHSGCSDAGFKRWLMQHMPAGMTFDVRHVARRSATTADAIGYPLELHEAVRLEQEGATGLFDQFTGELVHIAWRDPRHG